MKYHLPKIHELMCKIGHDVIVYDENLGPYQCPYHWIIVSCRRCDKVFVDIKIPYGKDAMEQLAERIAWYNTVAQKSMQKSKKEGQKD